MQNFLIVELGRAAELGLPAQALLAWAGSHLIGQVTDPGYNPYLVGQYVVPDRKKGPPPAYFKTWAEVMTAWAPQKRTTTEIAYWPAPVNYFTEARAAAALTARLPGGDKAWNAFNSMIAAKTAETKQAITWGVDPSWAIIPRTR